METTIKSKGLTEIFWFSMSEDQKLKWRFFSGIIALIGVLLITSSGNEYFDSFLKLFTTAFLLIVIQTQRSYSKISPKLRKLITKAAIILGTWGIAVFGLALYMQVVISVSADVFFQEAQNMLDQGISQHTQVIFLFAFLITLPIATIRGYKQLKLNELIFRLPREGLIKLLVHREPKAETFAQFAYFELAVIFVCLMYFSLVSVVARFFIDAGKLLISLI